VDYSKMYRKKVCGKKKYPETANIDYSKWQRLARICYYTWAHSDTDFMLW
jgi:hypothetical protein